MIIGCQDQDTYITSEHIVSFDIYDTYDSHTAIDANMDGSDHLFSCRIGKFKNREVALGYLTRLADMIRSNTVSLYVFDKSECV